MNEPQRYDPALHRQRLNAPPPSAESAWTYGPPHTHTYAQPPARRKRRVFLWVFLAIQALFLIWIIAGAASKVPGPSAATQAARQCANGGWQGLFSSQADCQQHYAVALNDAGNAGKGIGVALIVVFWVVVDFFLGVGYVVYKLAGRSS